MRNRLDDFVQEYFFVAFPAFLLFGFLVLSALRWLTL